ncbi:MAG: ABC transporter substrate-binding protein [Confluentimicrobium sp.]|nr:ABC transporter substrate-binding protein [Pacificitalea manganoxidans]MBF52587.1 ABC transporter substrate-binding protein [Actibacterium sp.]MDR6307435.1 NitT/TauT family transport system substrate-binding protein [Pacificitalea manganoxidans]OWU68932.1 ABC transporter substrate-binding protein [Roseovarius sp. 22II1-1F6A]
MTTRRQMLTTGVAAISMMAMSFAAHAQDLTKVTLAIPSPSGLGYFALYNAIGEGYMAEEGIEVEVQSVNGSAQVLQVLAAGQAEFGHPGPGPLLNAREGGEDIVYIYNYFSSSQFSLVAEADSGFTSPADLKGKVVGVGTADGAEVAFVRSIFDAAGMKEDEDYSFITIGEGGMAVAGFMQDAIDAYASDTVGMATLRLRGIDLVNLTPSEFKGYFGNGYAVTREYLDENRDLIEGFGRALVRGAKFGAAPGNLEATLDHAEIGNPQLLEDRDFARALLETYIIRTAPAYPEQGYGYQHPDAWQNWHDTLVSSGDLAAPMEDLTKAYTNEFIETWNAE